LLFGAQSPEVGAIGIEGSREALGDPQSAENPQEVLQGDAAVSVLETTDRVEGHIGAIGELGLGETAQLSPGDKVAGTLAEGASDCRGNPSRRTS
jgi:hypothetical protein